MNGAAPAGPPAMPVMSRHSSDRHMTRRDTGFSLLELMVVLVVLSLAVALTLPALGGGRGAEQRAATRVVAAALRQTRSDAITHGRQSVLEIDVERRSLELPQRSQRRQLPGWLTLGLYTARSELLDESRGRIRFFPDGSSTGGRVSVGGAGQALLVDVEWLTGRVRVLAAGESSAVDETGARAGIATAAQ